MKKNTRKKQRFFWIITVCTLCIGVFYFLKPLIISSSFPDFSSYYYGSLAAASGDNPYNGGQHFFTPFVYPPSLLIYMYPITFIPFQLAEKIITIISMIAYILSLLILDHIYTRSHPLTLRLSLVGILLATFFPAKFTFGMGQINSIVLLFISLFLYFCKKQDDLSSAICLALSLSIKIFPAILLLFLISQKKWKVLFLVGCILSGIGLITLISSGTLVISTFIHSTLPHLLFSPKTDYYNQSIPGMISRLISDPGTAQMVTLLYTIILVFPLLIFSDLNEKNYPFGVILSIVSSLLVNTFAWQHHFILILPAFFILLSPQFLIKGYLYLFLLCASYCLLAANISSPNAVWKPLWAHQTFGGIIIWGILLYNFLMQIPLKKQKHIQI